MKFAKIKNVDQVESIAECRAQIDKIDSQLLKLLAQRAQLAKRIGYLKGQQGIALHDPIREQIIMDNLLKCSEKYLPSWFILSIYKEIMSACLKLAETESAKEN